MNLEADLTAELDTVAEDLTLPYVSVLQLERAGRREQARRRTLFAATASAAVVLVIATATALSQLPGRDHPAPLAPSGNTDAPAPEGLAELPEGPVSQIPHSQSGILHIGTTEIQTRMTYFRYSGGTTIVGRGSFDTGMTWYLVDGGDLVPMVESVGSVEPVISPDGAQVVWSDHQSASRRHLVVWDVATRTETGTLDLEVQVQCCDQSGELMLYGADLDGVVFYDDGGRLRAWSPGRAPVTVTGVAEAPFVAQLWPRGLMYQGHGPGLFISPGVYGTVDQQGVFHRSGATLTDQAGTWSPDGSVYAYQADDAGHADLKVGGDRIWLQDINTGETNELPLPAGGRWSPLAWETSDDLIVQLRDNDSSTGQRGLVALVRCHLPTNICERTADSPSGYVGLPN